MIPTRIACAAWLLASTPVLHAGDLRVERTGTSTQHSIVGGRRSSQVTVRTRLRWRNGWRNERNHDAVWLVLRSGLRLSDPPLRIDASGRHSVNGTPASKLVVSADGIGAFVLPAVDHRGDVDLQLSFVLDLEALGGRAPSDVGVHALEMVAIPAGPFELGDDHADATGLGAFFQAGDEGEPAGVYRVQSESAIAISPEPGALFYRVDDAPQYRGDQAGPLPAAWPKGTRGFYVMKYELRQGQYASFLNALPAPLRTARAIQSLKAEGAETSSIELVDGRYVARVPERPCNFVTWDDTAAFTDWMALRPMTEFEFEKAARGPRRPVALDYPWGTADREGWSRRVQPNRDLSHASMADEASLSDATRAELGASYYWVMDLSGSLWERVVSAGHPTGRAFHGTHGDGRLDPDTARATNDDWPRGSADGRDAPGIGYRGGAEYFADPDLTNPASPVAVRTYAAWSGAFRSPTYSARACRTAPIEALEPPEPRRAMKTECEKCQTPLAADAEAYHCSFDCTFCRDCTKGMEHVCPNCGGELERRDPSTDG